MYYTSQSVLGMSLSSGFSRSSDGGRRRTRMSLEQSAILHAPSLNTLLQLTLSLVEPLAHAMHPLTTRWRFSAVASMHSLSSAAWHGMENQSIRKSSFPSETIYRLLTCLVSLGSLVLDVAQSSASCLCYATTLRVLLCTSQIGPDVWRPAYQTRTS